MKSTIIYTAAFLCAVIAVLSTRFVIPAATIIFKAIEKSFAPIEDESIVLTTSEAASPVAAVTEPAVVKPSPRKARRRKPSAKTLARAEAALA